MKAGIGGGAGLGGLAIIALAWFFIHKRKEAPTQNPGKKDRQSALELSCSKKPLSSEYEGPKLVYEIG